MIKLGLGLRVMLHTHWTFFGCVSDTIHSMVAKSKWGKEARANPLYGFLATSCNTTPLFCKLFIIVTIYDDPEVHFTLVKRCIL